MFCLSTDGYLDSVCISTDGSLLLAASSLTNRYWTGSLWHFDDPDTAPDVERCAGGVELEWGVTDAKWINGSSHVIAACDSGQLRHLPLVGPVIFRFKKSNFPFQKK